MSLAVVCGLLAEAKIAASPEAAVIAVGGDAGRLSASLDGLPTKPTAILSFGVAGGLSGDLRPGDLRVAQTVVTGDGSYEPDAAWSDALASKLDVARVVFAGSDVPVASTRAKEALRATTGADLVDMESHHAAAWAARNGARFAAVRVVTDASTRALPHAAAVGMRPDGSVALGAILTSLARDPMQIPALIRTGLEARAAFAALLGCRQRLGPRFALFDL